MDKAGDFKQLGSRISGCRQNRNLTQEGLAYRLGITPQALSKWERNVSLPDVSMLAGLSRILGVSTDYLLGLPGRGCEEESPQDEDYKKWQQVQIEIGENVNNALDGVEWRFGTKVTSLFLDNRFADKILELRRELSWEGIILPIVRIKDDIQLGEQEFAVLAYRNVLHLETLETLDENTLDYMIGKLGECVRRNYHEIINPDLVKHYVDNLRIKWPALIDDVVPENITYSLLTETVRMVIAGGISILYLPKMIETMTSALRDEPNLTACQLAERIRGKINREDNWDEVMKKRREKSGN